jgi:D-xylose 1-dehydrogenase (NADP+, D-xylono-1,5-lactone-forming)
VAVAWGFLSTAAINRLLLDGAGKSDRVEVVAVASRDAARAEAYAREHGIERAHGSYEALLEDPDVDAVYISLPNSMHVDWSIRALEAGKHVLCEKPFGRRTDEVERAFDVAERAGRLLSEAFMYRHHPQSTRLRELVEEGAVGRVRSLRSVHGFDIAATRAPDDVRLSLDLDGGALMDVGCYCVNIMRLVAGEPERVYGEQVLAPGGVDMDFHATMSFPGEVAGQFFSTFAAPVGQGFEVIGSKGTLRLEAPFRLDLGGAFTMRRGDEVVPIEVEEADSYQLELEDLSDAIESGREPLLGRDDAVGTTRALEALYRSAETREPVEL